MDNNRKNNNQPKKRVVLELTEPMADGSVSTFIATATASEGSEPMDTGIIFMVNGKPIGETETTDDNGVATKSISLEKGSYNISAMIEGTSYSRSKNLIIKGPEKKVPADLRVLVSGKEGDFIISIQVLDSGKNGIDKAAIQIIDGSEKPENRVIEAEADSKGSYTYLKKFQDKNRVLTIVAKGTPLKWQRTLWGKPILKGADSNGTES
ncbi:MAG: hypothetical protein PHG66_01530 [Candidatus Colwellbacteria bacterium]|nr:hypothetical protein [Candidatus Colwellbacteria bacterium]